MHRKETVSLVIVSVADYCHGCEKTRYLAGQRYSARSRLFRDRQN